MYGLPESGLAETLREGEALIDGFDRLEITTCLRRGELEIVTRYEPDAPLRHWSPEVLGSPEARRSWVEPDRGALPWSRTT